MEAKIIVIDVPIIDPMKKYKMVVEKAHWCLTETTQLPGSFNEQGSAEFHIFVSIEEDNS